MRRILQMILFVAITFTFTILYYQISDAKEKLVLRWGATSVRSGLYAITADMARVVNKAYPNEIEIRVVETGGYTDNLNRIQKKTVHMGPSDITAGYANYLGLLDYRGKANPNLRIMWGGYITPIHIIVSEKSGITDIRQLNGVEFAMNPGTSTGRLVDFFFKSLNIYPSYKMISLAESVDAMKAGTVKGWYKSGFRDKAIVELESSMDIRILPVTQQMIDQFNNTYPGYGHSIKIPAGLFKSVKKPQMSLAFIVTDFIDKDVPEDVVFKIVKAVWENRQKIANSNSTLKEGDFEDMFGMAVKYSNVPFHAGAVKFYRDVLKLNIPRKLLPPEIKVR
ncbi:TAXI family TRAP transporter solute-binding subunit [Thermodesulfovibrio sp.]|uniref:TAXI family TRAP transporter solute-binding subunit n=1 Tax=Thermodesulfovibrio sp. TaxID=2067987 RepID=UPI0030A4A3B1